VSFISALRELESPVNEDVLNLAATLGQQHEDTDDAPFPDAATIRTEFLRREEEAAQLRLEGSREHLRLLERHQEEAGQRDRLRRVMSRLSRLNDNSAAYGDRVPSRNSLYDWSPANEADDEDELDQILAELRREQPDTHPEVLRVLGRSQLDSERERIRSISHRLNAERTGSAGESLRSTAILQSVRRHPRFSARTREYLQRYNSEREAASRPGAHSESRESQARFMSESARQMALQRLAENRTSLDRERRDMLSRADSYRRSYLDHRTSNPAPTVSPLLEQTVKYLSRIRHSNSIDDSLNRAMDAGFLGKDDFSLQYADFITDPSTIPPPAKTSWLAPGAVLSGCQHATAVAATATAAAPGTTSTNHFRILDGSGPPQLPTLPPPSRPWLANSFSTPRSRSSQMSPEPTPPPLPQDRWPVKVTIHEVDWEAMTLSATMEAYNVPSHPHSHQSLLNTVGEASQQYTRTSSITTYLEGEILDFNQHTLLTESFKSSAGNDATYWRKLPPFQQMSDEEVIRVLTSKRWYTEVLNKEYILMRWKERCFVKSLARPGAEPVLPPPSTTTSSYIDGPVHSYHSHIQPDLSSLTPYRLVRDPTTNELQVEIQQVDAEHATFDDSGCGLTISGFYYVCLRRSDGRLEGLYYDPQSSPYQCLKLESKRGGAVGAWQFR
tara:strand:+ start:7581 stop:9593 length:2013 start_codon:yes stop_codon:yes gene_type:complete